MSETKKGLMHIGILRVIKGKGDEIRLVKMSGEIAEPQIKKYEEEDLSALVKIVNENYMDYPDFFYEFIPYTEETLRSKLEGRPVVLVAEHDTIEGFIACYEDPRCIDIDMLCVKRGPNRTKIEDTIISKVEEKAKGRKVTITLSSDSHITDFEKRGYEIYGGLHHLTMVLEKVPPIPPLAEGVTLRGMAKGEEEAITRIFYDPDHVGTDIFKPGFTKVWKEDWSYIAELNGKIVAIVCTRADDKFNAHFNAKRVEIWGPIGARGIPQELYKRALMCYALSRLREKGMEVATVWDAEWPPEPTNFRISLGFRVKNHWKFLRK